MATFLFRCPATGLKVQGWVADDGRASDCNAYETITCLACRQSHLVIPATGKVLSSKDEDE
jgi:hypothetical protein